MFGNRSNELLLVASWLRIFGTTTWRRGGGGNPYMTTSVDGGVLSRTGRGEGGEGGGEKATQRRLMATQRRPEYLQNTPGLAPWCRTTRRCPVHWAAADFRGKQPLCEATLPGLSPRGRTTRRLPVNWGLADSQGEQPQPELWRRSKGSTQQHMEVLDLIVVSTLAS